jgi:hypothetical protein
MHAHKPCMHLHALEAGALEAGALEAGVQLNWSTTCLEVGHGLSSEAFLMKRIGQTHCLQID